MRVSCRQYRLRYNIDFSFVKLLTVLSNIIAGWICGQSRPVSRHPYRYHPLQNLYWRQGGTTIPHPDDTRDYLPRCEAFSFDYSMYQNLFAWRQFSHKRKNFQSILINISMSLCRGEDSKLTASVQSSRGARFAPRRMLRLFDSRRKQINLLAPYQPPIKIPCMKQDIFIGGDGENRTRVQSICIERIYGSRKLLI